MVKPCGLPNLPEPLTADMLFEATGVPLLDELMRMPTVDAALAHSIRLASIAVSLALLGTLVVAAVDKFAGRRLGGTSSSFNAPLAALASAFKPAKMLMPYLLATYITTLASAMAQVAATKMKEEFGMLCRGAEGEVLFILKFFTQVVQDTSELLVIVFVAWVLIDFKNRFLSWLATSILSDSSVTNDAAVTLLRPLGGVLTFLILLAATAFAMGAYGLNLGPVIASVGGVGVVVGFATQGLLMNAISAIALFTTRPFVAGDDVELTMNGMLVVRGTVVQMEPMRTVIKSDDGGVVYVNNSEVTKYIIKNMTQGRSLAALGVASDQQVGTATQVDVQSIIM
ncbi:hypothetical protein D9Q98_007172 [Chlorella vulgaris]|uniref:Mechanosensitive ion channel MscS domain-containing protein n=1 Tax=Chlorella vulgaris TaxID=3077 RepID=A0A9D4TJN6_CHLVU|nr:hypothetical protein D9Q98_007172 [Chlorella vulgaris]